MRNYYSLVFLLWCGVGISFHHSLAELSSRLCQASIRRRYRLPSSMKKGLFLVGRLLKFLLRPVVQLDHRRVRLCRGGFLVLEDVRICTAAASEVFAKLGVRVIDARLDRMQVVLPWRHDSRIELDGLVLVLQPSALPWHHHTGGSSIQPQPLGIQALTTLVSRLVGRVPISLRGLTLRLLEVQRSASVTSTISKGVASRCVDLCVQWLRVEDESNSNSTAEGKLLRSGSIAIVLHSRPQLAGSADEPAKSTGTGSPIAQLSTSLDNDALIRLKLCFTLGGLLAIDAECFFRSVQVLMRPDEVQAVSSILAPLAASSEGPRAPLLEEDNSLARVLDRIAVLVGELQLEASGRPSSPSAHLQRDELSEQPAQQRAQPRQRQRQQQRQSLLNGRAKEALSITKRTASRRITDAQPPPIMARCRVTFQEIMLGILHSCPPRGGLHGANCDHALAAQPSRGTRSRGKLPPPDDNQLSLLLLSASRTSFVVGSTPVGHAGGGSQERLQLGLRCAALQLTERRISKANEEGTRMTIAPLATLTAARMRLVDDSLVLLLSRRLPNEWQRAPRTVLLAFEQPPHGALTNEQLPSRQPASSAIAAAGALPTRKDVLLNCSFLFPSRMSGHLNCTATPPEPAIMHVQLGRTAIALRDEGAHRLVATVRDVTGAIGTSLTGTAQVSSVPDGTRSNESTQSPAPPEPLPSMGFWSGTLEVHIQACSLGARLLFDPIMAVSPPTADGGDATDSPAPIPSGACASGVLFALEMTAPNLSVALPTADGEPPADYPVSASAGTTNAVAATASEVVPAGTHLRFQRLALWMCPGSNGRYEAAVATRADVQAGRRWLSQLGASVPLAPVAELVRPAALPLLFMWSRGPVQGEATVQSQRIILQLPCAAACLSAPAIAQCTFAAAAASRWLQVDPAAQPGAAPPTTIRTTAAAVAPSPAAASAASENGRSLLEGTSQGYLQGNVDVRVGHASLLLLLGRPAIARGCRKVLQQGGDGNRGGSDGGAGRLEVSLGPIRSRLSSGAKDEDLLFSIASQRCHVLRATAVGADSPMQLLLMPLSAAAQQQQQKQQKQQKRSGATAAEVTVSMTMYDRNDPLTRRADDGATHAGAKVAFDAGAGVVATTRQQSSVSLAFHGLLLRDEALGPATTELTELLLPSAAESAPVPMPKPVPALAESLVAPRVPDSIPATPRVLWRLYVHVHSAVVQHLALQSNAPDAPARTMMRPHAVLLLPSLHLSSNALPASSLSAIQLVIHSAELLIGLGSVHTHASLADSAPILPQVLESVAARCRPAGYVRAATLSRLCVAWQWSNTPSRAVAAAPAPLVAVAEAPAPVAAAPAKISYEAAWHMHVSNDTMRIETCADSTQALLHLLSDLAWDDALAAGGGGVASAASGVASPHTNLTSPAVVGFSAITQVDGGGDDIEGRESPLRASGVSQHTQEALAAAAAHALLAEEHLSVGGSGDGCGGDSRGGDYFPSSPAIAGEASPAGGARVEAFQGNRGLGGVGGLASPASASAAASSHGTLSGLLHEQDADANSVMGLRAALVNAFGHGGSAKFGETDFGAPRTNSKGGSGCGGLSVSSLTSSWHSSRSPDFGSIDAMPPMPALEAAPAWVTATAARCVAETPPLPSLLPEQQAGWLPGRVPHLIEHHVSASLACAAGFDSLGAASSRAHRRPFLAQRSIVSELCISWHIRPGYDWPPAHGRTERDDVAQLGLELRLRGLNLQAATAYVATTSTKVGAGTAMLEWRLSLVVREFELLDRLHGGSGDEGELLLGADEQSCLPRDHDAFLASHLESVAGELRLRLQLQALRLRVDQRSLDFLHNFLQTAISPLESMAMSPAASPSSAAALAALASDALGSGGDATGEADRGGNTGGNGGGGCSDGCSGSSVAGSTASGAASGAFFQMCEVKPVHLCIDYLPRRPSARDVCACPSPHQLANLLPLREVRLSFGRLRLTGQPSWEALVLAAVAEWQPQLLAQLHRCISGTVPLRPLISIGSGVSELLTTPVQTYRNQGRVLRGLRHGSTSLTRSVLTESMLLVSQLLRVSQTVLTILVQAREADCNVTVNP